jgi:hypothetical protein
MLMWWQAFYILHPVMCGAKFRGQASLSHRLSTHKVLQSTRPWPRSHRQVRLICQARLLARSLPSWKRCWTWGTGEAVLAISLACSQLTGGGALSSGTVFPPLHSMSTVSTCPLLINIM